MVFKGRPVVVKLRWAEGCFMIEVGSLHLWSKAVFQEVKVDSWGSIDVNAAKVY